MHMVHCVKLGKELPGLEYPPVGGELGERIWANVSEEAWKFFLEAFKRLMNEERLIGGSPEATDRFIKSAERFFFGDGTLEPPAQYKPQ
jgi:Fe-S cluster biosynthesis and repair protein YggX